MQLTLSDHEAEVLRTFLGRRLGDLSMEISHTDNPAYRRDLRADRDTLRRVYDVLTPGPTQAAPTGTAG